MRERGWDARVGSLVWGTRILYASTVPPLPPYKKKKKKEKVGLDLLENFK